MAIIKNQENSRRWQDRGENWNPGHCLLECKMMQLLWETVEHFLKLSKKLPCDPAIQFLDNCPKELKAGTQTDIFMPMVTAALFTTAKRWKPPKCLSTDQ